MRTRLLALALAPALLALTASAAEAASPPSGTYPCFLYIDGTGLVGSGKLKVHSGTRYSVNDKKKGAYSTSGRKINFKTGDYSKSNRGRWERKGGVVNIYLYKKSDTKYEKPLITCSRR